MTPSIQIVQKKHLFYKKIITNYNKPNIGNVWKTIIDSLKKQGSPLPTYYYGIINFLFNNNNNPDEIEYMACIEDLNGAIGYESFKTLTIETGDYAIFHGRGSFCFSEDLYKYIYGQWIFDNKCELRDSWVLEQYNEIPSNKTFETINATILLPVKKHYW